MIPCIVLAGPIGLGFGYMRQTEKLVVLILKDVNVIVLWRRDYSMIPLSWMSILEDKDVHAFFSLLLPATISLAFAHIASFTDLCFSSLIPGATAGLSCK
ncbi:hypothetical protein CsSME_00004520 [Camellia sinensis var. sinensis]